MLPSVSLSNIWIFDRCRLEDDKASISRPQIKRYSVKKKEEEKTREIKIV